MSRLSGMYAETTWDPGAANAAVVATQVTVAGARKGDFAWASHSGFTTGTADDCVICAMVSADDTVNVSIYGDATAPNVSSGTLRVKVVPFDAI